MDNDVFSITRGRHQGFRERIIEVTGDAAIPENFFCAKVHDTVTGRVAAMSVDACKLRVYTFHGITPHSCMVVHTLDHAYVRRMGPVMFTDIKKRWNAWECTISHPEVLQPLKFFLDEMSHSRWRLLSEAYATAFHQI